MVTMFNFLYELHNKSGQCVLTQSVTGKRIAPMLEHIARVVTEHKNVTVHVLKARVGESVLVDPKRMESLSALVTMGVEHYNAKVGDLVVENAYTKTLDETLSEVLSDPKKAKKLVEAAEKHQVLATARKHGYVRTRSKSNGKTTIYAHPETGHVLTYWPGHNKWEHYNPDLTVSKNGEGHKELAAHLSGIHEAEDKDTLELPDLSTGDTLLVGKFKNRRAEIKGFSKDENNQPVADTTKGDQKIFKPRIAKIMPGAEEKKPEVQVAENVQGQVRKNKEAHPEKYCSDKKCLWALRSGPCSKHGEKK
jgi:hypothetical protein